MHDLPQTSDDSSAPLPGPGYTGSDFTGLVQFLVEDPSGDGVSREALVRAVHSLVRERDYLRRARDLHQSDHESQQAELQDYVDRLERLLETECAAHRAEAQTLRVDLESHRDVVAALERECDALRADRDAWRQRARRPIWKRATRFVRGLVSRKHKSPGRS